MTKLQMDYLALQESKRHNVATEDEAKRSNLAKEAESARHNLADEGIGSKNADTNRLKAGGALGTAFAAAVGSGRGSKVTTVKSDAKGTTTTTTTKTPQPGTGYAQSLALGMIPIATQKSELPFNSRVSEKIKSRRHKQSTKFKI